MIQVFSNEMLKAMNSPNSLLVYFVELRTDEPSYLHTGIGDIKHDGKTWYGLGSLGEIGAVKQKSSIGSNPITFSISALDDDAIRAAFNEGLILKDAKIYLASLGDDHRTVLAFDLIFTGFITDVGVNYGNESSIVIEVSNKIEKWVDGLPNTFTDASHRIEHPQDMFFRYQSATANMEIRWGNTATKDRTRY